MKQAKDIAAIALLVMALVVMFSPTVDAVSPKGYLDLPNQSAVAGPIKTVNLGAYPLPGKGLVDVQYENVLGPSRLVYMENGSNPLTANYMGLGFNGSSQNVPTTYTEVQAGVPGVTTFMFDRATKEYAIMLFDVDQEDIVTMRAVDENNTTITNFSGWQIIGTGDATTGNPPGGADPAPVPTINMPNGTFTSTTPTNTNRSYVIMKPNVALKELSFTLNSTVTGSHIYTGLYSYETPEMTLGDRVWNDANNNGVLDNSEKGIGGVLLELLDATTSSVLSTTTTATDGKYSFAGLSEGEYVVRVAASNFMNAGALTSYRSSLFGSEPAVVNNTSVSGVDRGTEAANLALGGVSSGSYQLLYDSLPETDGDSDRSTNLSVQFGFINTAQPTQPNSGTSTPSAPDAGVNPHTLRADAIIYVATAIVAAMSGRAAYAHYRKK